MAKNSDNQPRCPVDGCPYNIDPTSPFQVCKECTRIARVILYALPRISKVPAQPSKPQPPRLILPTGIAVPPLNRVN